MMPIELPRSSPRPLLTEGSSSRSVRGVDRSPSPAGAIPEKSAALDDSMMIETSDLRVETLFGPTVKGSSLGTVCEPMN